MGVDYINNSTGLALTPQRLTELLARMSLPACPSADGTTLHVQVPPTRSDVLHACDVMEVGRPCLHQSISIYLTLNGHTHSARASAS